MFCILEAPVISNHPWDSDICYGAIHSNINTMTRVDGYNRIMLLDHNITLNKMNIENTQKMKES